jgi:hypothetical protein
MPHYTLTLSGRTALALIAACLSVGFAVGFIAASPTGPAMFAYSAAGRCSDDNMTWWPARVYGDGMTSCVASDKPSGIVLAFKKLLGANQ